jgi:hypothetical protein
MNAINRTSRQSSRSHSINKNTLCPMSKGALTHVNGHVLANAYSD